MLDEIPPIARHLAGDQAMQNVLVHNSSLWSDGDVILTGNNDSLVYTMHHEVHDIHNHSVAWETPYPATDAPAPIYSHRQDDSGRLVVYNRWNLVPAVVHQFDRIPHLEDRLTAATEGHEAWKRDHLEQSGESSLPT